MEIRMARLLLFLILVPCAASAADEGRISFLEQEVRNLQRQVLQLSRQVDELRTRPGRVTPPVAPASGGTAADPSPWLDAAKWRKLRPGMSELEVVSTLGPPTSMREEGGARTLYYALEIGSSGFLGGSVMMHDRVVVEVRQPVLQ
jgi:hypothetical protein